MQNYQKIVILTSILMSVCVSLAFNIAVYGRSSRADTNPPPGWAPPPPSPWPPVTNPVPTITSISPTSVAAGTSFTLTVNGTGFVPSSLIQTQTVGGNQVPGNINSTKYVSSTQLTALMSISPAQTDNITVFNPTPGGGTSNQAILTVTAPPSGSGGTSSP